MYRWPLRRSAVQPGADGFGYRFEPDSRRSPRGDYVIDRLATVSVKWRAAPDRPLSLHSSSCRWEVARSTRSRRRCGTGYVALYEIVSASGVRVLAARHQREEDRH